jgi:hypothetical protein
MQTKHVACGCIPHPQWSQSPSPQQSQYPQQSPQQSQYALQSPLQSPLQYALQSARPKYRRYPQQSRPRLRQRESSVRLWKTRRQSRAPHHHHSPSRHCKPLHSSMQAA